MAITKHIPSNTSNMTKECYPLEVCEPKILFLWKGLFSIKPQLPEAASMRDHPHLDEFVAKFHSITRFLLSCPPLGRQIQFPLSLFRRRPTCHSKECARLSLSGPSVRPSVKAAHNLGGAIVDLVKLRLVFRPNFWGRSHCHLLSCLALALCSGGGERKKKGRRSHRNPPTEIVFAAAAAK